MRAESFIVEEVMRRYPRALPSLFSFVAMLLMQTTS